MINEWHNIAGLRSILESARIMFGWGGRFSVVYVPVGTNTPPRLVFTHYDRAGTVNVRYEQTIKEDNYRVDGMTKMFHINLRELKKFFADKLGD